MSNSPNITLPLPNLFFITTCYVKIGPYPGFLYLIKKIVNTKNILEVLVNHIEESIDIDLEVNEKIKNH